MPIDRNLIMQEVESFAKLFERIAIALEKIEEKLPEKKPVIFKGDDEDSSILK